MLTNSGVRPRPRAIRFAISTSKPTSRSGCRGSASTNGAPPSGSPAQRSTRGCAAAVDAQTVTRTHDAVTCRPRTAIDCIGRLAMANVAFLGTGMMGSGMTESMLRRGDSVTVWNRTEAKARALEPLGATVAASPADAVAAADRVHLMLPDDAIVDRILEQCLPRLRPDAVVIDHSTTSPSGTKARLERLQKAGVSFLHAPVFMSPQMTRDAIGLMLVSGPRQVYDKVIGMLEKMTGEVWYLGERPDV